MVVERRGGNVAERLRDAVAHLNVDRSTGERAVHKPLLTLMILGHADRGGPAALAFADVDALLADLLREFGPPRKRVHPEYPFWYLQSDGFWVVDDAASYPLRKAGHCPPRGELVRRRAVARVPEEFWRELCVNQALRDELIARVLAEYWPATLHEAIRSAIGLPEGTARAVGARPRDPEFRELILKIYERRCAVCGFDGRLGRADLLVEAAHVRWHSEGGADAADNGIALCTLHHVSLDRGALGLTTDHRILVSEEVAGSELVDDYLRRWSHRSLRPPQEGRPRPSAANIGWHRKWVFRDPPRGGEPA